MCAQVVDHDVNLSALSLAGDYLVAQVSVEDYKLADSNSSFRLSTNCTLPTQNSGEAN